MSHNSLEYYYQTNFALIHHYKYSLTELENMIPWEKEVYINYLENYLEEQRLKQQQKRGI